VQDIFLPICTDSEDFTEQQCSEVNYLLTEKASVGLLNAAITAYDNDKGLWPIMVSEDRVVIAKIMMS
jgi:hypothetical protein